MVQLDKCEKQLKTQRREQRAQTLKALELRTIHDPEGIKPDKLEYVHDKLKSIN